MGPSSCARVFSRDVEIPERCAFWTRFDINIFQDCACEDFPNIQKHFISFSHWLNHRSDYLINTTVGFLILKGSRNNPNVLDIYTRDALLNAIIVANTRPFLVQKNIVYKSENAFHEHFKFLHESSDHCRHIQQWKHQTADVPWGESHWSTQTCTEMCHVYLNESGL